MRAILLLVGALAAVPGLAGGASQREEVPRPNLLLVTLDTTRADHLGAWGWPHARTPTLDALARSGIRFVRCDTVAPLTVPAHASILTGLDPPRHGVRDNTGFRLTPEVPTVAALLRAAGYDTAAVISAAVLHRRHRLDRGFGRYDDDLGAGVSIPTRVAERTADSTVNRALEILRELRRPFFLWVHFYDPHEAYRPPPDVRREIGGPTPLYDGEIAFVDRELERLLQEVPKATVILAVGDHGEMLGEHGEPTHGVLPLRAARRVPLILSGPGIPRGRTETRLVSVVDVAPTLLLLGGVSPPPGIDGRPLVGPEAPRGPRMVYSESLFAYFAWGWYPLRTLSDGRWTLLDAPTPELFATQDDAQERRDLSRRHPGILRRLLARLDARLGRAGERRGAPEVRPAPPGSEELEMLATLGYLGGGAGPPRDRKLPDPRGLIELVTAAHRASELAADGRCSEALEALRPVLRRAPHAVAPANLAGMCLLRQGEVERALGLFRRAARLAPALAAPHANAGGALLRLGRRTEARQELELALRLDPAEGSAAAALARLHREEGETLKAVEVLENAIAAGAREAEVFLELGISRAVLGRLPRAMDAFREAARRDPTSIVALENAARAAYHLGRVRESAGFYRRALRVAPDRWDLWRTLGAIYLDVLDDRDEALRCFRRALANAPPGPDRATLEEMVRQLRAGR